MNSSSLSMFLLLLILMITISNYFVANKTEYSIRAQKDILESAPRKIHREFYQRVLPEAICKEKVRIGERDDGGKYVCKPEVVMDQEECTIMSLGLNNQIGFDEYIAKVTGGKCMILGADKDEQRQDIKNKYAAINGKLFAGLIPKEITIPEMMKNPDEQIFIELLGTTFEHLRMLQVMAKYNFRIFNVDPNYICNHCCEYSLINENCMEKYGVIPLAITIPKETL